MGEYMRHVYSWRLIRDGEYRERRVEQIMAGFSSDAKAMSVALAELRFGRCEACGGWRRLVVHHWWEQGEPHDDDHVHFREVCGSCNNELSTKGDHVLPSWREQLLFIRGLSRSKVDTAAMSAADYAHRRMLLDSRRVSSAEARDARRRQRVAVALDKLRVSLRGSALWDTFDVVDDYFSDLEL